MITLEDVLTGRGYADLNASPLQLAIVRAADGRDLGGVLDGAAMSARFGVDVLPAGDPPKCVVLVCGVRSGKSFITACAAIKAALTADLSGTKAHELPRAAIVAPFVDNAVATFRLLCGIVESSPVLRGMRVKEPTEDTLVLRRPHDGREVEIVVVAAHRGGMTVRSRWLVFLALEEVAGFGSESMGAIVNGEEILRAGETRLVPGGQIWVPSSPFGPVGLLYQLWKDGFGMPGRTLVVHAPTLAMNPTFSAVEVEAIRTRSPDVAAREFDATWLDADSAFLDSAQLEKSTRSTPLEHAPQDGVRYVAAWDAATRGNSWTLVVGHGVAQPGGDLPRVVIDVARQWTGSRAKPLSPELVIGDIADLLERFRVRIVHCDTFGTDAFRDIASKRKLTLEEHAGPKFDMYQTSSVLLASDRLEFAPHPILLQDLRMVRKKALANGMRVDLPSTPDGRHCDFAPSAALVIHEASTMPAIWAPAVHRREHEDRHERIGGGNPRLSWRGSRGY